MERLTNLTLEQIMTELRTNTQDSCHGCENLLCGGKGILVNDVGMMANNGNREAEAFLCELMLCHDSEGIRATSYCYLKNLSTKQEGTERALQAFIAEPQNAPIIKLVADRETEERTVLHDLNDRHLPGNS